MGCAPFTYHPFYLQRVCFHHHHYHWSSIGNNDPKLVSKINRVVSPLVLAKIIIYQLHPTQDKITGFCTYKLRLIKCLLKLLTIDKALSHLLHLLGLSLCAFVRFKICPQTANWTAREEAKSHWLICLSFLHCAFSNVSSNHLPQKRHSHIGSIYFTFLHSAFLTLSDAGVWRLYLTLLHCAFLNVSSNCTNYFVLQNTAIEYTSRVPGIHPGPKSSTNNS